MIEIAPFLSRRMRPTPWQRLAGEKITGVFDCSICAVSEVSRRNEAAINLTGPGWQPTATLSGFGTTDNTAQAITSHARVPGVLLVVREHNGLNPNEQLHGEEIPPKSSNLLSNKYRSC